ncbi:hypothetical protein QJQ45_001772 [Haematococcus lacustris]|nr:hypothetical protein QJQ45_001772 [Haematococcus lacustris]
MAEVAMERHGRAKQLVVFFGAATIGTRSRGTDQRRGRVVLVDEHCTTRGSLAGNGQQPCEEELDKLSATRPAGWKPSEGQALCSSQAATQLAASEPGPSTPQAAKRSKRTNVEQAAEPTQPTKGKGKAQGKAS